MDMTTRSTQAVNSALASAQQRGNPTVESAHLALALLDDTETLTRPLLQAVGADVDALRAEFARIVDRLPSATGTSVSKSVASTGLSAVIRAAEKEARERSDEFISAEHLLLALAGTRDGGAQVADALAQVGATPSALSDALTSVRGSTRSSAATTRSGASCRFSPAGRRTIPC